MLALAPLYIIGAGTFARHTTRLAGDYTNSIHTDAVNRAIQRNLAMQVVPLVAKFLTDASGATWFTN